MDQSTASVRAYESYTQMHYAREYGDGIAGIEYRIVLNPKPRATLECVFPGGCVKKHAALCYLSSLSAYMCMYIRLGRCIHLRDSGTEQRRAGVRDVLCTGNRLFRKTLPSEIISDKESFLLFVKNFT